MMKHFFLLLFLLLASWGYSQNFAAKQKAIYDSLIQVGMDDYKQKKLLEAELIFALTIQLDSTRPDGYYGLGVVKSQSCFQDSAGCPEAMKYLRKAMLIAPGYRRCYYNLSVCEGKTGDLKAELKDLDLAIAEDPTDSDYFHNRGVVKYKMGDDTGACADFTKAAGMGNQRSKNLLVKCK